MERASEIKIKSKLRIIIRELISSYIEVSGRVAIVSIV